MNVPRLHAVAADGVLAAEEFIELATALMETGGRGLALHLRAHRMRAAAMHERAAALAPVAARTGALLLLNDRADVALALAGTGVVLGKRSLPPAAARPILEGRVLGYSAHSAAEAASAVRAGADFVLLGTIYETESHPGRAGAGLDLVRAAASAADAPVIAIGGMTAERVAPVVAAGAHGVAVHRGIFAAADPLAAMAHFLDVLGGAEHSG